MKLTERDREILIEINRFGFVDVDFIATRFNWHIKKAYRRLRLLKLEGFLTYEAIFYQQPGVYRLSHKGIAASQDSLPPLRKINLATYHHHLAVAKLSIKLSREQNGTFISERTLRQELGIAGINEESHVPDGLLKLAGKAIAIELELTLKSQSRLEKIMRHYRKATQFDEVWYFCGNKCIEKKLSQFTDLYSFLKLHPINMVENR